MSAINTVLFDLDGTIINTNKLIIEALKYSFREKFGQEPADESIFYAFFGRPLRETYETLTPDVSAEMIQLFRSYNWANHDRMVTLFPDVTEVLSQLNAAGYRLAIVTSKMRPMAIKGLNLFDLEKYFAAIVAEEDTIEHKPRPEPVLYALELLKSSPEQALLVGDSTNDILCAQAAGIRCALVAWSCLPAERLKTVHPDYYLSTMTDIFKLLRSTDN